MRHKTIIVAVGILFFVHLPSFILHAQNLGININGTAGNSSTWLDIGTPLLSGNGVDTKGVLIPRVALTATNSGSPITPAPGATENGLLVYNTATAGISPNNVSSGYYYWDGTKWVSLGTPSGIISMWSGSSLAIPAGWALCDGLNGTPDLRDRFIVGAGSSYAVAATGGNSSVTLTTAQLPAHSNTGATSADGNHAHTYGDHSAESPWDGVYAVGGGAAVHRADILRTTAAAGNHNHTFTTNNTGSNSAIDIRPPYYALAYIMKL